MSLAIISVVCLLTIGNAFAQENVLIESVSVESSINIGLEEESKSFTPAVDFGLKSGSVSLSNFEVDFINFPENAKTAFMYAISIYESQLSSTMPIRVEVKWESIGVNILAHSKPSALYKNFDGAVFSDVYYPVALAEKLADKELNSEEADIVCTFNSNISWYLGTNGNGPSNQYDFVTVALHEMMHGLGFTGFFDVTNGVGNLKGSNGIPSIYDLLVFTNSNLQLANTSNYVIPSTGLKGVLESNKLKLKDINGIDNRGIYAPAKWNSGSSVYHYNESGFAANDADALMSPCVFKGEAIHKIGDQTMNLLNSLGWKSCRINGTAIKDIEQAVAQLQVSAVVSSELDFDRSSVKINYSTDNRVSWNTSSLSYNTNTKQFEGMLPLNYKKGKTYYYYEVTLSNEVKLTYPSLAPERNCSFTIGTDYYPPVLKHEPLKLVSSIEMIMNFSATASDNVGINNVSVEYSINGAEQVPFQLNNIDADNYAGDLELPVQVYANDEIEYRIIAVDNSARGNKRVLPAQGFYTVTVEGDGSDKGANVYTSSEDVFAEKTIRMYPNPCVNNLFIDCNAIDNASSVEISITDLYGKSVYRQTQYDVQYNSKVKVDLSSISSGIYLASVTDSNSNTITQKIIKN